MKLPMSKARRPARRPAVAGSSFGMAAKIKPGMKPAAAKMQAKPAKMAKPSGTNKGPSAQAFAHANANASFKRSSSVAVKPPTAMKKTSTPSSRPVLEMPARVIAEPTRSTKFSANTGTVPTDTRLRRR